MISILLAQLIAPPTQEGPIRLPGAGSMELRPPMDQAKPELLIGPEKPDQPTEKSSDPNTPSPLRVNEEPKLPYPLSGNIPYSRSLLHTIFQTCVGLEACAERLRRRLAADGYLNSQVLTSTRPPSLQVILGRLEAIRVEGPNPWLNRRLQRLVTGLQGQPLRLPAIEQQLRLMQRQPGVKTIQAHLTSIDQDPRRAQLALTVTPGPQPFQGEFTARNDGSNGSGEYRGTGVLLKNALAVPGDTLLLFGEMDGTDDPEVGTVIGSISYTLPLTDILNLTGAFGYKRQTPVELDAPLDLLTTDQYQYQLLLEWVFKENLLQRWAFSAGINANESQLSFDGESLPSFYPSLLRNPRNGYLRFGLNGSGLSGPVAWLGNAYLLQGVGGMTPGDQRNDLAMLGVNPGQATALGALASASWFFAPSWQLKLRAGGQVAFQPLTSPMKFSLGSDVGIRGLPDQLISGDSGWLGTGELAWTFWQHKDQSLQVVPFIGAGGVYTDLADGSFNDTVGSCGLLARWLAGDNFSLELGYAHSFNTDNNKGAWNDWLLDSGLYAKASYRF